MHLKTTTGRLNDLSRLAILCDRYGKRLLIDAVSSFGGQAIDFESWPIDAIAATANKCLHGVPGISFVLARKSVLETQLDRSSGLYLDLATNWDVQRSGTPAFTPRFNRFTHSRQALQELKQTGEWQARLQIP